MIVDWNGVNLWNERLVRSGGSLKNTSWKGEKLLNASDANVFIP